MKKILKVLISGIIITNLFYGCVLAPESSTQKDSKKTDLPEDQNTRELSPHRGSSWRVPVGKYAYYSSGFMGATNEAGSFGESSYLESEYEDWKEHYITSDGADGHRRVQRDFATYYDTVSEGIAYGMLLAVYFDDRELFDDLFLYAMYHANEFGLMHWKVDARGNNVCEIPALSIGLGEFIRVGGGATHVEETSAYTGEHLPIPDHSMDRYRTSAADADLDMAAALIFAHARWGSPTTPYQLFYADEAKRMLQAIYDNDTLLDAASGRRYVVSGCGDWGGSWGHAGGWNPSYVTLAWFPIFDHFMTRNDSTYTAGNWLTVYDDMSYVLNRIDSVNGNHGLFPDWVDSTDLNNPRQSLTVSDRGPLPYNSYYDAVRVPWRISLAESWYHRGPTYHSPGRLRSFIASKGGLANIKDGYMPDGSPFDIAYADWNNVYDGYYDTSLGRLFDGRYCRNPRPDVATILNARGEPVVMGGVWSSPTFTAMYATVYQVAYNDADIKAAYYMVKNNKEDYGYCYNYYGNTLRLLSMLYLTGNMKNLYTCRWMNMLHVNGTLSGTKSGYYLIKNRINGTYLSRDATSRYGSALCLKKGCVEDLDTNSLWRLVHSSTNGRYELINLAAETSGSAYRYLLCSSSSSLNNTPCSLGASNSTNGLWRLYDNSGGNSLFVINPSKSTGYRIYATDPQHVIINRSSGGGKYWQIIRYND